MATPHPTVNAPEIDLPGLAWFNVAAPLSLAELRGKIVILDFWTFCCINCMHVLPTLRRVEEAFPNEVVVIGVHTPKFAAERDGRNVAAAIARYGIVHPVIHDPDFMLWRQYAVRAWPTLVFVGPDGKILGQSAGEPDPERLLEVVEALIAEAQATGQLEPRPLDLVAVPSNPTTLSFPGKIKAIPGEDKRWALADAGHNQIVILDDGGAELARYGSGQPGFDDGSPGEASFNAPQGLVCAPERIYVADTGNHAIRVIELDTGTVKTLAGTGHRGRILGAPEPGMETALASVWDLELDSNTLYFANAGTHQLGVLDLAAGTVARLAGNGGEDIVDGPGAEAQLAQPSGLSLDTNRQILYFADSETSAVRKLTLNGNKEVETLTGKGLFDFGHRNGPAKDALLQHPLGVALASDAILIADSYNSTVRILRDATVADFDEGHMMCTDPICLPFAEPAGIAADGADRVLLSDTNNHRIVEFRLADGTYRTWTQ